MTFYHCKLFISMWIMNHGPFVFFDRKSEGSMKYPLSNCPLFNCLEFFSRTTRRDSLNFLHKVRVLSDSRNERARFLKNILFWGFWAKRNQNKKFHQKSVYEIFLIFYLRLRNIRSKRKSKWLFLGKICWGFGNKRGQNGLKMWLFKFYKKLTKFFWFLQKVTGIYLSLKLA